MRRALRAVVGAVVVLATAGSLGACAQIPMSGPVREGTADGETQVDIAMLPQGPILGTDPRGIVIGFLGAAVAASTSPKEFETAREFLTEDVAGTWDPEAAVRVVRESPLPRQLDPEVDLESTDTVELVVHATTIATLDSAGSYTEVGDPRDLGYRFTLVRTGGEWRISALDDGVLVPANLFANQYRATRLYFSAATDSRSLVPDLRWFPRRTWRADAVQQLLAGPPEWLQGVTQTLFPDGTQLGSAAVRETDGVETVAVRLSEQLGTVTGQQRAVIAAQLSATFSEGAGRTVPVDLYSGTNRLAVTAADVSLPGTAGQALVVQDGELKLVSGGTLETYETTADVSAVGDPTAFAVSPAGGPIVFRDGTDRIVNLTADGPVELFEGPNLAAPSVDTFGVTWTSGGTGALRVRGAGDEVTLKPEWLAGRRVISVSVAPEGRVSRS
nr:LpqB family beta-propeller domain-containing protein [Promicromonospora thailandica]